MVTMSAVMASSRAQSSVKSKLPQLPAFHNQHQPEVGNTSALARVGLDNADRTLRRGAFCIR